MAFSTFKTPKLGHFSKNILEILYTYTPDMVLSHVFRFFNSKILKIRKIVTFLKIIIFVDYFSKISKLSKFGKLEIIV